MTRKDFRLIAEVLHNTKAPENVILAMADVLKKNSPTFDVDQFLEACRHETTYRLASSSMVFTPGIVKAAVAQHKASPGDTWPYKVLSAWPIPEAAIKKILQGQYSVDGDVVCVTV